MSWVVYVLECGDHSLYVGVTNDLEQRLAAHESGKGARYTRGRGPLALRYVETAEGKGAALSREAAIRKLGRRGKLALIANTATSTVGRTSRSSTGPVTVRRP